MGVGQALKEARSFRGLTQTDLSDELYVARSTVAMTETGRRELPDEVVPLVVTKLDCGFLAMEVAHHYTAGSFVSKLNGQAVDLHRSSVKEKSIEELREALDAINGVCIANRPERIGERVHEQLEYSLLQVIDAIVALTHYVAVVCREYGFSWREMWRQHRKKLRDRGYLE